MKVLLYSEGFDKIKGSGLGRALLHQKSALDIMNIEYTTNKYDDYDLVHINTLGFDSYRLARKTKKAGKTVVYHAHSTEEDFRNSFKLSNLVSPLFKKWICTCYQQGDVIITPTDYSKALLEGYGIKKPIHALSNGINVDFYKPQPNDRKEFRDAYGFSEEDKVVLSVGLFFKRKGLLDFVELAKRMPQYHFIWFGSINLNIVPNEIKKAVATELPNLHFPGYVSPDNLKKAYVGCDLYFFPTYEETEGIVLLEALAARANVLVRDIPAFSWLKANKEVYKASGIVDMEDKITAILEKKLPDISYDGYLKVTSRDLSAIGKQLVSIYESVTQTQTEKSVLKLQKA